VQPKNYNQAAITDNCIFSKDLRYRCAVPLHLVSGKDTIIMESKTQKEPHPDTLRTRPGSGAVPDAGIPASDPKTEWKKRLLSLDAEKQKQIALKYYGGHMPWKD
jgi:hypothetical protein